MSRLLAGNPYSETWTVRGMNTGQRPRLRLSLESAAKPWAVATVYNDPMEAIRRNDHSARIEILPLIDVVFLLLTFFIFSMLVMVRLEVMSVKLTPLGTGKKMEPSQVEAWTINIDRRGRLMLGNEPITVDDLTKKLQPPTTEDGGHDTSGPMVTERPMLFIAMSRQSDIDRAPLMVDLIKRFVAAGIEKYTFVGPSAENLRPRPER